MSKDMVEQIADCLLQNHMELMAEVKHLRDEVERVTANNYDRGWNDAIARAVAVLSDAVARREPASTYVAMITAAQGYRSPTPKEKI